MQALAYKKRIEDKTVFMSVAGTMNVIRGKTAASEAATKSRAFQSRLPQLH